MHVPLVTRTQYVNVPVAFVGGLNVFVVEPTFCEVLPLGPLYHWYFSVGPVAVTVRVCGVPFLATLCVSGPKAVIVGLTVTAVAADVALQPFASRTVTLYEPEAVAAIDCVVAPLLHAYCDIPAGAESVTLPPWQNVVGPLGVMVVSGSELTFTVALPKTLQPLVVTLTWS